MFILEDSNDKEQKLKYAVATIKDMLESESNLQANLANISAVLNFYLDDINWVGFYVVDTTKENELVLSSFQGNVACTRIKYENGVCGKAISTRTTQLVDDVHKFPGHIACDGATNSEIVIPIVINDIDFGVLDIDSPNFSRFDEIDKKYLEQVVTLLVEYLK